MEPSANIESRDSGYSLVIAEKPDAAKRIASALGQGRVEKFGGVDVIMVDNAFDGRSYRVCAAAGHLYGLTSSSSRLVYPTFDIEWRPLLARFSRRGRSLQRKVFYSAAASRRIRAFSILGRDAKRFVNACDYDIEGETIGWNILVYACKTANLSPPILRARFSTLTQSDIRASFSKLETLTPYMALAGRARHAIDFVWGVNFSRALTDAQRRASKQFNNLTIGRVQTPTLTFVVKRESEIRTHVPIPFWSLSVLCEKGKNFELSYEKGNIATLKVANEIAEAISLEPRAFVTNVTDAQVPIQPPYPLNTGRLQAEAYRIFKLTPSATILIAEKLYLAALISYPRTDSQRLPPTINYPKILEGLEKGNFSQLVPLIAKSKRRSYPIQGPGDDSAHPAIFPTGLLPRRSLTSIESKVYELVVRNFLAAFADNAIESQVTAKLLIGEHRFLAEGRTLAQEGWRKIYPYFASTEKILPRLQEGDKVPIISRNLQEKRTRPPTRFDQASLLAKMEAAEIGTKATRAQTISTLVERGYIQSQGRSIVPSEISFSIVRTLENYCPEITSQSLTRSLEVDLSSISDNKNSDATVVANSMQRIVLALEKIRSSRAEIGKDLSVTLPIRRNVTAKRRQTKEEIIFGKCPACFIGSLRLVVSPKTGKRFIGCSRYSSGCRTSGPLPQNGKLEIISNICSACNWPLVSVLFSNQSNASEPWSFCPNPACAKK